MDVLKKLNYIFGRKQKIESIGIIILIMIGTVLELLGVSTVQPLIDGIMYPEKLMKKTFHHGASLHS